MLKARVRFRQSFTHSTSLMTSSRLYRYGVPTARAARFTSARGEKASGRKREKEGVRAYTPPL